MHMSDHEFHMMQLADSFFPAGIFGMSGGLESFVKAGRVRGRNDVLRFIRQQIRFQLVPCDCSVLLAVMNFAKKGDLAGAEEADNLYFSMKSVKEIRTASTRSGRQLLSCVAIITNDKFAKKFYDSVVGLKSAGTYPACLGVAVSALRIPEKSAVRMIIYSYSGSIVSAAVRLAIITHVEGQKILTQLARDANSAKPSKDISEMWQLTPLPEIIQMHHEQQDQRMFIT